MKNLFGKTPGDTQPSVQFGRFSSSFKTPDLVAFWDKAMDNYTKKNYLDAYDAFFKYLSEPGLENIKVVRGPQRIEFEILQGSKRVFGTADPSRVTAEVQVARFKQASVAFMRRLLDMNYSLTYSRFGIKDDMICMRFDTASLDGSPWKLYYGLQEMATRADRIDDLLVDEFSMLEQVDNRHITDIPAAEKEVKYAFTQRWIAETLTRVKALNADKFSGGISYLLLDLTYRLDYLVVPEGSVMDILVGIHRRYFSRDDTPFIEKNRLLTAEFEKIQARPKEAFINELYRVTSTFSVVNPTPHQEVAGTIDNELKNLPWYLENKYPDIALAIINYIPGYSIFTFGLNRQTRQLFHLLLMITNADYFRALGVPDPYYDPVAKKFDKGAIRDEIGRIIKTGAGQFPKLKFPTGNLNYDGLVEFGESFLRGVQNLDYNA